MKKEVKVLNKYFALLKFEGSKLPEVIPNPFELSKQWVILDSARGDTFDLPFLSYSEHFCFVDEYPDLCKWVESLGFQNSPSKINFRSNPTLFRELVEKLDFSKPFDPVAVKKIQDQFITKADKKDISSDDIVDAELSEET